MLDNDKVNLTISDNGIGFDTKNISEGFGLKGLLERTQQVGGELLIESEPGKGTNITVSMPNEPIQETTDA